jgi:hypothetical protein
MGPKEGKKPIVNATGKPIVKPTVKSTVKPTGNATVKPTYDLTDLKKIINSNLVTDKNINDIEDKLKQITDKIDIKLEDINEIGRNPNDSKNKKNDFIQENKNFNQILIENSYIKYKTQILFIENLFNKRKGIKNNLIEIRKTLLSLYFKLIEQGTNNESKKTNDVNSTFAVTNKVINKYIKEKDELIKKIDDAILELIIPNFKINKEEFEKLLNCFSYDKYLKSDSENSIEICHKSKTQIKKIFDEFVAQNEKDKNEINEINKINTIKSQIFENTLKDIHEFDNKISSFLKIIENYEKIINNLNAIDGKIKGITYENLEDKNYLIDIQLGETQNLTNELNYFLNIINNNKFNDNLNDYKNKIINKIEIKKKILNDLKVNFENITKLKKLNDEFDNEGKINISIGGLDLIEANAIEYNPNETEEEIKKKKEEIKEKEEKEDEDEKNAYSICNHENECKYEPPEIVEEEKNDKDDNLEIIIKKINLEKRKLKREIKMKIQKYVNKPFYFFYKGLSNLKLLINDQGVKYKVIKEIFEIFEKLKSDKHEEVDDIHTKTDMNARNATTFQYTLNYKNVEITTIPSLISKPIKDLYVKLLDDTPIEGLKEVLSEKKNDEIKKIKKAIDDQFNKDLDFFNKNFNENENEKEKINNFYGDLLKELLKAGLYLVDGTVVDGTVVDGTVVESKLNFHSNEIYYFDEKDIMDIQYYIKNKYDPLINKYQTKLSIKDEKLSYNSKETETAITEKETTTAETGTTAETETEPKTEPNSYLIKYKTKKIDKKSITKIFGEKLLKDIAGTTQTDNDNINPELIHKMKIRLKLLKINIRTLLTNLGVEKIIKQPKDISILKLTSEQFDTIESKEAKYQTKLNQKSENQKEIFKSYVL